MKSILKHLFVLFLCATLAAYSRMCFPSLAWQSWQSLGHQSIRLWIGAIIGMPLVELYTCGLVYLVAAQSFVYFSKRFSKSKFTLKISILLGLVHGAGWYFLASLFSNSLWKIDEAMSLFLIYSVIGVFYGMLYYKTNISNNGLSDTHHLHEDRN